MLPPLVCVTGSVRHLKLGPLGTDASVMTALAQQTHTHHNAKHTHIQQGAAGKHEIGVLSKGPGALPPLACLRLTTFCLVPCCVVC